jgi:WD40 repeat protein
LASDDHQISLYEATTLEKFLVLDLQTSNAMCLDFFCKNPNDQSSMLIYGTDEGYTNAFYFNNSKLSTGYSLTKTKTENIYMEKDLPLKYKDWGIVWKRKAHSDWVVGVTYIPFLNAIISCSPDNKYYFTNIRESISIACIEEHKWIYSSSEVTSVNNQ